MGYHEKRFCHYEATRKWFPLLTLSLVKTYIYILYILRWFLCNRHFYHKDPTIFRNSSVWSRMGLLRDTSNYGLRMHRECLGRFSRHRLQRKSLVSALHASRHVRHARVVMHVGIANPRCGENVPGIPGACATRNFPYLVRGPWRLSRNYIIHESHVLNFCLLFVGKYYQLLSNRSIWMHKTTTATYGRIIMSELLLYGLPMLRFALLLFKSYK